MPRKSDTAYKTENSVFATRLREIMRERGENQTSLAEKITAQYVTIQRQTISLYMNGQSKPDTERLTAIAKVLDVSADYLLGLNHIKNTDGDFQQACNYIGLSEGAVEFLRYIGHDPETPKGDIMPLVLSLLLEDKNFFEALSNLSMACSTAKRYGYSSDVKDIQDFKRKHWEELLKLGADIWDVTAIADMFVAKANSIFFQCLKDVHYKFILAGKRAAPGADTPGTAIGATNFEPLVAPPY